MVWPFGRGNGADDDSNDNRAPPSPPSSPRKPIRWDDSLNKTDWTHYTQPSVVIPTVLLTATTLTLIHVYKRFLRRIPSSDYIRPALFRKSSVFGQVTSVGDGDNFRLFHTPGGRLAGWGWLWWKRVPAKREELKGKTLHIRLAGIDAPELAHFGRPVQPFAEDALAFLTEYIGGRRVRAYIYRRDQYERVVATVLVRRGLWRRDVGLEMLKRGLATVYEAKYGSEFGGFERKYRAAQDKARRAGVGMWAAERGGWFGFGKGPGLETPREYKVRMGRVEAAGGEKAEVVVEKKAAGSSTAAKSVAGQSKAADRRGAKKA
ncbi:SNase-domain-containing protein [Trichodelitschia bisporula]|uniref:Probable endonuclease LCL3 n=1 Tax=Trichodelitschia bisporula TaxID=703511 RepID=A0A6G1I6S9_9PEZI|nr:SNase-domain-containing protein [Trichodelitschia bisporula]